MRARHARSLADGDQRSHHAADPARVDEAGGGIGEAVMGGVVEDQLSHRGDAVSGDTGDLAGGEEPMEGPHLVG